MSERPSSCPECGLWSPCSTCCRPTRTLAVVETPDLLVDAQGELLRQSAAREARLRVALRAVRDAHENSRKAWSKGARPYDAAFLWACYGHEVDAALEEL